MLRIGAADNRHHPVYPDGVGYISIGNQLGNLAVEGQGIADIRSIQFLDVTSAGIDRHGDGAEVPTIAGRGR